MRFHQILEHQRVGSTLKLEGIVACTRCRVKVGAVCHNWCDQKGYEPMPNWRFWEKRTPDREANQPVIPGRTATVGEPVPQPPPPAPPAPLTDTERDKRLATLKKRREGALFDLGQAELALQEDNPWRRRIDLLTQALDSVESDREALKNLPKRPSHPLPAVPIEIQEVRTEEPPSVSFKICNEVFQHEEELDWAERGTTVVRGELQHRAGDPAALPMVEVPSELQSELADHLTDSMFAFATDLRDRALAGEPMPEAPTLADLAKPCPECGGWQDWKGHCPECTRRQWQRQQLDAEANRLDRERAAEIEEQAQWAERLPIARKRLADIDAELALLGVDQ
jgi:hypothetical protein